MSDDHPWRAKPAGEAGRPALLPCPFCGNTALTFSQETTGHGTADPIIECSKCSTRMLGVWMSNEQLAEKWNRRPGDCTEPYANHDSHGNPRFAPSGGTFNGHPVPLAVSRLEIKHDIAPEPDLSGWPGSPKTQSEGRRMKLTGISHVYVNGELAWSGQTIDIPVWALVPGSIPFP